MYQFIHTKMWLFSTVNSFNIVEKHDDIHLAVIIFPNY